MIISKLFIRIPLAVLMIFANYLRQFGKAVHVLEPAELHDKLQESVKKTLDYYKRSTHE